MGMADTVTKEYIRSNEVFADAFNYLIYDGEQVVKPALLQELDTTEIAIPFALGENENQTEDVVQKYRDVLKSAVIMQDSRALELFLLQCILKTLRLQLNFMQSLLRVIIFCLRIQLLIK